MPSISPMIYLLGGSGYVGHAYQTLLQSKGLAFRSIVTSTPLNTDEPIAQTGIIRSRGVQAIKTLEKMRAAHKVPERKENYELQTDLGVLVRLFVNSRVLPRLNELTRRQAALTAQARASENSHLIAPFTKVERWQTKTAPLIALIKSLANTP